MAAVSVEFRYRQSSGRSNCGSDRDVTCWPSRLSEHPNARVDSYLWGLLPDNEIVLSHWARKFHVSARNAFGLIASVGEDCTGAIQFVRPERLDTILNQTPRSVEWINEEGVAQRLRARREDHAAWRIPRDTGQFSLADRPIQSPRYAMHQLKTNPS